MNAQANGRRAAQALEPELDFLPEAATQDDSSPGRRTVIVGGGVGWAFDKGLGTSPWGLIVFLLLGFAAGIYNVMRSSGFLKPTSAANRSPTRDH